MGRSHKLANMSYISYPLTVILAADIDLTEICEVLVVLVEQRELCCIVCCSKHTIVIFLLNYWFSCGS